MTKLVFASTCVFFLLIMTFPTALFAQKPKIEWDSINHKYLYFVDRPPTNSRIELVALIYKQLNEKGYKNNYMNDCCGESRKALNQFLKENGFEILTEAALNKLDIEMIHEVEIDDSWASPQLQKALRQFQRDNGLREGFLDDKTLKALGIAE